MRPNSGVIDAGAAVNVSGKCRGGGAPWAVGSLGAEFAVQQGGRAGCSPCAPQWLQGQLQTGLQKAFGFHALEMKPAVWQ